MHTSIQFQGQEEANKIALANMPPRYRRLEDLERWVEGRQYEGRPSWWDDKQPLWERAPCIVYPVVQIAIQSNVDLVLGEGRAPTFTSKPGEEEADEDNGLGEDDSQKLDRFIVEHHRISRFRAHCRDAFAAAQGCGTAVAIHGARAGKPFQDLIPAKWGNPTFDVSGAVIELEIRYPYFEEFRQRDGSWGVRCKLYRRVIDAEKDTTFLPADAKDSGAEPDWQADPKRTYPHGFGFCPVVWYPLLRGCAAVNVIDGTALHALLTNEIQGHDFAVSQRHRCALFSEPQVVEIGVDADHNPTDMGRPAVVPATEHGGRITTTNPQKGAYLDTGGSATGPVRKKGPGNVWRFPNPETKVEYLSIPADSLKAIDDNARDLRIKLQEALGVVFLDPENIKFAATTSGKALEAIKQKQIDRCDQFRDDLRDNFLLPSVDMQLRIAHKLGAGLKVPGAAEVQKLLSKFDSDAVL
ncbi:MAG TPA: hypothetical protein VL494_13620 [Steroidobacteraceae bacterium]|jgi:hypothetical protein|nr:hypothetical protein [Steroidobacteraceae bacterium]